MADYSYTQLDSLLAQVRRIEAHRIKGAEAQIKSTYQGLLKELRHYLADTYTRFAENDQLTFGILQKHGYYGRFLEEVEKKVNAVAPEVKRLIRSMVGQTYEATYNGLAEAVKKAAGGRMAFDGLKGCTPDIVRRAVDNPIAGLTLNDRLEKNRKGIIYDIKKNITVGLTNGDRYSTMANRIKQSVDGNYKKAIRITRTETHRVRQAGEWDSAMETDKQLQANGGRLRMEKTWKTMRDERVRPARRYKTKKGWKTGKPGKYDHKSMEGISCLVDEEFTLPSGAATQYPGGSGVAGEDINCRCYLSYKLKPMDKPQSIVDKASETEYNHTRTAEELQSVAEDIKEELPVYAQNQSKWSGKINIDNSLKQKNKFGQKEWNCDITLIDSVDDGVIWHEMLHSCSVSYYDGNVFADNKYIEEASVEFLKQQICKEKGIINLPAYTELTIILQALNGKFKYGTDMEFAKKIYNIPLPERYQWLDSSLRQAEASFEDYYEVLRFMEGLKGG